MINPHYFVTGIWKDAQDNITHLYLHPFNGKTFGKGIKQPASEVIKLIRQGMTIMTLRWNYQAAKWTAGARLEVSNIGGIDRLKTRNGAAAADLLQNMVHMDPFASPAS